MEIARFLHWECGHDAARQVAAPFVRSGGRLAFSKVLPPPNDLLVICWWSRAAAVEWRGPVFVVLHLIMIYKWGGGGWQGPNAACIMYE